MNQVLINKPIHPDALEYLRGKVGVLLPYSASRAEVHEMLPDVDAIILCAGLTVGAEEMDLAPHLQVIGRHGVGLDNVDVTAASSRRIPVTYTPNGPTESTAEHTLLLILAAARRLPQLDRATRSGDFGIRSRSQAMGRELHGKSLGVVGFGRIGRRVAEMCREALQMSVHVFDPYVDPETVLAWGATPAETLTGLARAVDVLTIHTPLTPETRHLVNREVIQALRMGAILVNASRGAVVEQSALAEALASGRIAGAGLDVYDPEPPPPDNPLFQLDQVVLTPHVASLTHEGRRLMGLTVAKDVLEALAGNRPRYLANPEVWEHRRIQASGQSDR